MACERAVARLIGVWPKTSSAARPAIDLVQFVVAIREFEGSSASYLPR